MQYPQRKPNRYADKELYKSNNSFFVTLCTQNRICVLGNIGQNGQNQMTASGKCVQESWESLDSFVGNVKIEEFVVMPNHFHGVITFLGIPFFKSSNNPIYLSQIIGMFKSKALYLNRQQENYTKFEWQKSFYDHIVRNEQDLIKIKEYIINNPLQWSLDILNPINNSKYDEWIKSNN
jgi:putative transposase